MNPAAILSELHRYGVAVEIDGDRSRLAWDSSANPPTDLIENARQHREAIIALAVAAGESEPMAAGSIEAIPETARPGILRLAEMASPGDFPPARWSEAVDACQYVAELWLLRALDLGWPMLDIFGCHPEKPRAAIHAAGLALCIQPDDRIMALAEATAAIARPGGTVRTFRRAIFPCWRVLIWDLSQ